MDWLKLVANEEEESDISSSSSLWRTAVTITVADVIMSLDNVLAVAAAGKGHLLLVALGVLISIPIIVAGSKLVLAILTRFPSVVLLGGALIGWIAGSMMITDPTLVQLFPQFPELSTFCCRGHWRGVGAAGRMAPQLPLRYTQNNHWTPSPPTASSFRHFSPPPFLICPTLNRAA